MALTSSFNYAINVNINNVIMTQMNDQYFTMRTVRGITKLCIRKYLTYALDLQQPVAKVDQSDLVATLFHNLFIIKNKN